ncbi:MAG: hypothetical protein EOO61_22625 [Hymenobacter sp.]|nr:MAG: hypothetical protein EOO61_22625 [Hymenobacter sp.]
MEQKQKADIILKLTNQAKEYFSHSYEPIIFPSERSFRLTLGAHNYFIWINVESAFSIEFDLPIDWQNLTTTLGFTWGKWTLQLPIKGKTGTKLQGVCKCDITEDLTDELMKDFSGRIVRYLYSSLSSVANTRLVPYIHRLARGS